MRENIDIARLRNALCILIAGVSFSKIHNKHAHEIRKILKHQILLNPMARIWKIWGNRFLGHQAIFVLINFYKSLRLLNVIKPWQEYYCYPECLKVFQNRGCINLKEGILSFITIKPKVGNGKRVEIIGGLKISRRPLNKEE